MKYIIILVCLFFFTIVFLDNTTFGQNTDITINTQKEKLVNELSLMENEISLQFKELQNVGEKYGWESKEVYELQSKNDVQNANWLIALEEIIKKGIWHGDGELGDRLISNLFTIVNHSDSTVQEKYLPLMREVVLKGKAQGDGLAVIEDRVSMSKREKQIYGSIIKTDGKTNLPYVYPLLDPDNVDKRRKALRLDPYAEYLLEFNIQWDVEQYKLDLPKYERIENLKY